MDEQQIQSDKAALRERIKELTCLYGIAQIAQQPDRSMEEILQGIVNLLPPAWQYPEVTLARLVLDGVSYSTGEFPIICQKQSVDIFVNGKPRGLIEIGYAKQKSEFDEGPFLQEERSLLNEVARQTTLILERRQTEEDNIKLYDQIRHADRLATIGMLAAGVAHELNEPLGNILGFAQLAKKCSELPKAAKRDIDKIEKASLYAREIIQKLLIFARQVPPEKRLANLNEVVEEGLYFFNARCAKEGVELICNLCPNLPEVLVDPGQLNQVLVNLVVNALQAMSGAGRITVQTQFYDSQVVLVVEDTGPGMTQEVLDRIYTPFFTTKDVGQGTGLGLPVVHGIVTAHGGMITVDSVVGRGTRFEIRFPVKKHLSIKEMS